MSEYRTGFRGRPHVVGSGRVVEDVPWQFVLGEQDEGYANAQIDDYAGRARRVYPWRPPLHLSLRARFSAGVGELVGTAGFGFWNAPFGDPNLPWPALPQAVWYFYGSAPTDLPLAPIGSGRGWFVATLDATTWRAVRWLPLSPAVVLLNQFGPLRRRIWPTVQRHLGISYRQLDGGLMVDWQQYDLFWLLDGSRFMVNGETVLETRQSPRGPLGFVAWIDNQFMVVTSTGRFRWGTLPVARPQWLALSELKIAPV